ncbi:hypothetical protein [Nocardiopsis nanhaiensis]
MTEPEFRFHVARRATAVLLYVLTFAVTALVLLGLARGAYTMVTAAWESIVG